MSKVSPQLDTAVRAAYDSQPHAADRIAFDPDIRTLFLEKVIALCPDATERETLQHLERLRKRGSENGGLPKKGR
ncbi:MAG: hypothetical protein F9B45_04830 [Phycisphaera sp. RhM]|nr:hypothetical protein [Phycisphaera sp. RhM]